MMTFVFLAKACCQAMEYSDCECYISPHVEPEEIDMEQTTRYVLCGLIGFPLGLGKSARELSSDAVFRLLGVLPVFLYRERGDIGSGTEDIK